MGLSKREKDNLDLDSRRALELGYGVHYGRYKADYPHTKDASEEPGKKLPVANCIGCGEEFEKTRSSRMFCCDDCRRRYYDGLDKKPANMNRLRLENCQMCGKPIRDSKMRRYCSQECAENGRYKLVNEYANNHRRKKKDEQAMGEQLRGKGPDGV